MNKKLLLIVILGVVLVSLAGFNLLSNTNSEYNNNPDVSKKIVGSKDIPGFYLEMDAIDQLTEGSDLIIIGKVISSPVNRQIDFPFPNEELKKEALKNSNGIPKVNLACSKIKIEEILYGQSESDIITLAQLGRAESDSGQTKVKQGDRMLFLLQKNPDDKNMFAPTNAEKSLFIIDNQGRTMSLSDNKFTSRYDGIDLKILKRDINKGRKKQVNEE